MKAKITAGRQLARLALLSLLGQGLADAAPAALRSAVEAGNFGLDRADEFRLADGSCRDCPTIPPALWYFRGQTIAVPKSGAADFARRQRYDDDIRNWFAAGGVKADGFGRPPLLWVGSPQVGAGLRLAEDGASVTAPDGSRIPFAVTPKIDSNLSYYDASSIRHFAGRSLRVRGHSDGETFVARTIWPEDYALDFASLSLKPLAPGETIESLVRADGKDAKAPLAARVLWQRDPAAPRDWAGKPVLAFMLNGAQGDDDEAHGGHFAIATGRFGERGEWGDWTVNNFYNLGSVSEKGIVASMLPMDNYMADLNSGQSWYRPSYMLVAVLKQPRAAGTYQEAIARVFNHFYRQDFSYRHTTANCSGISMETLRALGWTPPLEGPDSRLKASIALPYMTITDRSLDSGKKAFDYLVAERSHLYPFVAFDTAGRDLLQRVLAGRGASTGMEGMLAEDVEALVYVRIPQFPSSRAFGQAPVASLDEYMKRAPADRAQWKIVPVPPRPFPEELKDADRPGEAAQPSEIAVWAYGGLFGVCGVGLYRRRQTKRASAQAGQS